MSDHKYNIGDFVRIIDIAPLRDVPALVLDKSYEAIRGGIFRITDISGNRYEIASCYWVDEGWIECKIGEDFDGNASDNVSHPSHYCYSEYEPKDVIRAWGLNFNLGSSVKYIARAGRKDDILQDLRKAKQFLEFEIEAIEKERNNV